MGSGLDSTRAGGMGCQGTSLGGNRLEGSIMQKVYRVSRPESKKDRLPGAGATVKRS